MPFECGIDDRIEQIEENIKSLDRQIDLIPQSSYIAIDDRIRLVLLGEIKNKFIELINNNISTENKTSIPLTQSDYDKYDYIIAMETRNIINILKIVKNDPLNKISRLLDFTDNPRDIADPWYTHNFDKTYDDIFEGCLGLLEHIKEKYDLN